MQVDATVSGIVKWVGERTSKKGNKYYSALMVQNGDSQKPIFITSMEPIQKGRQVINCKITAETMSLFQD